MLILSYLDVSGEQQSLETDTLSEVLSDHTLVKREADPGRKEKKKKRAQKKCPKGKEGKKCRRSRKRSGGKGKAKSGNGRSGGKGKGKKGNGKSGGKNRGNKARQGTLPTCFEKMYKYSAKMKKANNIQKQFIRVNGSKGTINNKKDKKVLRHLE